MGTVRDPAIQFPSEGNEHVDRVGGLALVPASQRGGVPEWLKGADCKSAGVRLRWFESNPLHQAESPDSKKLTPFIFLSLA